MNKRNDRKGKTKMGDDSIRPVTSSTEADHTAVMDQTVGTGSNTPCSQLPSNIQPMAASNPSHAYTRMPDHLIPEDSAYLEPTRATCTIEIESPQMFPCKHCDKKFSSVHALGGHQTRHRVDKEVAKRQRLAEQEVERCCTNECSVGLCVLCMKSKPLRLRVPRPAPSEKLLMIMQQLKKRNQRKQQSAPVTKQSPPSNIEASASTSTGQTRAAAVEELDLTLRL